ncbi:MmpS family transport accessory protein [Mycolicibacterium aubagnense]|uniref:Membrane protein, MmpS n=1 Tax=Mycolicibacterium aubagnense TaxID=319707 RepID=A0ABM7IKZ0_9MYCO|nr:MmpS family transport accessory protein [Mycolicibacterium aubagnense]TLH65262.1 transport acessory protein MmpS [Mycolicibacterium aubagnense]WGI31138.1 MmpS family transport accessory protein [Mycolicibacterium aubagnense]BBX87475.1 putative membrane protein, MmpS [Mycolicibacterium aubagnense]
MPTVLARIWVPAVVVVAVALGAAAVTQLRGAFGSEPIFTATAGSAEPLEPTHVKRVVYEVFGPSDTAGSVNYLDQNAQPVQTSFHGLPWTVTVDTTAPATIASVVAQGDSGRLGCRITVDGEARQEHVVTGHSADQHAQTSCLVKNA